MSSARPQAHAPSEADAAASTQLPLSPVVLDSVPTGHQRPNRALSNRLSGRLSGTLSNGRSIPAPAAAEEVAAAIGGAHGKGLLLQPVAPVRRVVLEWQNINMFVPVPRSAEGDGAGATVENGMLGTKEEAATAAAAAQQPDIEQGAVQPSQLAAPANHLANVVAGKGKHKEKQILFNTGGRCIPGEVMALMGPSGSGKSSLLTLLGGRSAARTDGTIHYNGAPLTKGIKRNLGFVTQDDLLFAELTVFETLYFAAMLRLPRDWTYKAKIARVDAVIAGLGLERCRASVIGDAMQRGISGGERKRVSIGVELLINPSLILLDEPTSGLDATTALKLMHTLRGLATGGRTVVASIHQPSSRLYQQVDKGRVMFYGGSDTAVGWFDSLNVGVPFGVNVADHILDLATGDIPGRTGDDAAAIQAELVHAFEARTTGLGRDGVVDLDLELTIAHNTVAKAQAAPEHAWRAAGHVRTDPAHAAPQPHVSPGAEAAPPSAGTAEEVGGSSGEQVWGASWWQQVSLLAERTVKKRRSSALSWQVVLEMLFIALLVGCFWWQHGYKHKVQSVQDMGSVLFFLVVFVSWTAFFAALFTFPQDFAMLVKERQSSMYQISAYYTARLIADFPLDTALPSMVIIVSYWMVGLRRTPGAFFGIWFAVLLTMLVAQSVGLFIGALITNPLNAVSIGSVVMLSAFLVGGFFVADLRDWIEWLKWLSFIHYGWGLLLKLENRHRDFPCSAITADDPSKVFPPDYQCQIADGGFYKGIVDVNKSTATEACVLIAMLIFFRFSVFWALQYKTARGKA